MIAYLFTDFSKRKNSTKRPDLEQGSQRTLTLKEGTSLENPVFKLTNVNLGANYLYLQDTNSYYFINDIISLNYNQFELVCEMDVLATWKVYIENYEGFCYRTNAFIENTGFIPDGNVQGLELYNRKVKWQSYPRWSNDGTYVLRTVSAKIGRTYFLTPAEFEKFYSELIDNEFFFTKNLVNYIQYIKFMPLLVPQTVITDGLTTDKILIGNEEIDARVDPRNNIQYTNRRYIYMSGLFINLNQTDFQDMFYGDWRDYNDAWTNISLEIFGNTVEIPAKYNKIDMVVRNVLDLQTMQMVNVGYVDRTSTTESPAKVFTLTHPVAFDVQIATPSVGFGNLFTNLFSTIASFSTGEMTGAFGGISNSFKTLNTVMQNGPIKAGNLENSACIYWANAIRIYYENKRSGDIPMEQYGTPVCTNLKIGDLDESAGYYIQMQGASLDIPSLGGEKDVVNNLLNGGFYYE